MLYNLHKFEDVHHLTIVLGRACDMACPHCSQHSCTADNKVSDTFIEWVLNWARSASESKYEHTIMFWGGEPLLYLDAIKNIVSRVSEVNPDVKYKIHTNGKRLDTATCNYFYEHGFFIIMSYDLPNPLAIRSSAPDADSIAAFNAYKGKKRINAVYNAKTPSMHCIYEAGDKLFPDVEITFGPIRDSEGTPNELLDYEDGKISKDINDLWTYYTNNPRRKEIYNFFSNTGKLLEKRYSIKEVFSSMTFPMCGCGYSNIAIDTTGNVYTCQNTHHIVGNVSCCSFNELQDKSLKLRYDELPEKCKTCSDNYICKSSCLTYKKDGDCITQCDFLREWTKNVLNIYKNYIKEG